MGKHFFNSLGVKNFRGIRTSKIDNFARINLFVGKNSCGKTTVLESLYLLTAISDPREMIKFQNYRGVYLSEPRDWAGFFFNLKHENDLCFTGIQESGKRELTVRALCKEHHIQMDGQKAGGAGIIKTNNIQSNINDYLVGLEYKFSVSFKENRKAKEYNSKVITTWDTSKQSEILEPHIDRNYKDEFFNNNFALVRSPKNTYEPVLVNRMLREKRKDVLLESLKIIEPKVEDIQSLNQSVFADIGLDNFISLNLLGDGLTQILTIISWIDGSRGGVLMIDEFGSGLHVSCVEHIWKILIEQSRRCDVQVFLTTHSKDVVEGLAGLYEREPDLFSEDGDDVACFYLGKNSEGRVKGYRYSPEDLRQVLKSDTDIRH